jgi:hypothetical protein
MKIPEYLGMLEAAGFTTSRFWVHPHNADHKVDCRAVYDPNGHLLTSLVLAEFDGGVTVYFCAEHNTVEQDIEDLKGLWAERIRRKESRQPIKFERRAATPIEGMVD